MYYMERHFTISCASSHLFFGCVLGLLCEYMIFISESAKLPELNEMKIFTYVDKDFHIPELSQNTYNDKIDEKHRKISESHLSYGIMSLPQHNLHSVKTLPKQAAKVHARITKESPFKAMHIMAAVECDIDG